MSLKDKLEIGLKPDAPYRRDNLPDFQQDEPACEIAATPGDTPELRRARAECEEAPKTKAKRAMRPRIKGPLRPKGRRL